MRASEEDGRVRGIPAHELIHANRADPIGLVGHPRGTIRWRGASADQTAFHLIGTGANGTSEK